jgi:S-DNA-T family DNA segregation ATPase FtsK/SpoIIIE
MPISDRHRNELVAIAALLLGLFLAIALLPVDITGELGATLREYLWKWLGAGAVVLPAFGIAVGLAGSGWIGGVEPKRLAILGFGMVLLLPYAIGIVAGPRTMAAFPPSWDQWTVAHKAVGLLPGMLVVGVRAVVGTAGAAVLGLLVASGLTLVTLDWHPFQRRATGSPADRRSGGPKSVIDVEDEPDGAPVIEARPRKSRPRAPAEVAAGPAVRRSAGPPVRRGAGEGQGGGDELPPLELLEEPVRSAFDAGEAELDRLGQVLIDTLATFRVEGKIVGRTTGPVVTQFEVAPGSGVKVGRIAALADDLALAMRAQSIRIVAPIPGKAAVGVEVPNPTARIVHLRELLEAGEWERARGALPIALGKDLEGKAIVADLAKMPHLLIAGATGSGKSVCINTIITSLVYRYSRPQLRLLMIDPKMVELSGYGPLPHLRHPVVTNNRRAAQTLKWLVYEMERRYTLFNANGARNVSDFNRRVAEGKELVQPGAGGQRLAVGGVGAHPAGSGALDDRNPLTANRQPYTEGQLPYIVLIVDELADLIMTVQAEVEKPLAILAQKARATGIHLILATQRPSVNVITGLIKANFPSRIAFRVASKVDSRTILDQNGAEALLGNGDMLFLPPGKSEPVRIQGAFISTEETERLNGWFAEQKARREVALAAQGLLSSTEDDIIAVVEAQEAAEAGEEGGVAIPAGDRDPMFREAADVCIQHQLGSTSLLQRKLRIGYGRAARIIDQLHEAGILGPPDGSKPREVLIGAEQLDEYCD